jgi:hypothetical protein
MGSEHGPNVLIAIGVAIMIGGIVWQLLRWWH